MTPRSPEPLAAVAPAEDTWRDQVHNLMRAGYGKEDIAHKLGCPLARVEEEWDLLAAEGRLEASTPAGSPSRWP